jgi:hypothetical protein
MKTKRTLIYLESIVTNSITTFLGVKIKNLDIKASITILDSTTTVLGARITKTTILVKTIFSQPQDLLLKTTTTKEALVEGEEEVILGVGVEVEVSKI